jgi:HTH-type transcriptional regulator / antitoxin HipB
MGLAPEHLADVVRYHRKRAGLTRRSLADLAGVSEKSIYEVENGKATVRLDIVNALLDALNIDARLEGPLMAQFAAEQSAGEDDDG